jgi:hypothetical protein
MNRGPSRLLFLIPQRVLRRKHSIRPWLESLEDRSAPAVITVNTTGDTIAIDTFASLREAITSINNQADVNGDVTLARVGGYASTPGGTPDVINFNIPATGVQTISASSAEPTITMPLTINGDSQPGASANTLTIADNAVILIQLDGASAGAGVDGLTLGAGSGGSTIEGLDITRFTNNGIVIRSSGNTIAGNFIGVDPTGSMRRPNGVYPNDANARGDGVRVESASNNIIGGTIPASRNIVSGNTLDGIHIIGSLTAPATGNMIQGNFVGVAADGKSSVGIRTEPTSAQGTPEGNNLFGIEISGGVLNTIGGMTFGARNVLGFNWDGIDIDDGSQQNTVQGNLDGVSADGAPAGNVFLGIAIRSDGTLAGPFGPGQANEPGTSFNLIGGTVAEAGTPGPGNLVEFNGTGGVAVFGNPVSLSGQPNIGNAIERNWTFENGRNTNVAGSIGIDLSSRFVFPKDDGITPNDSQGHGAPNDPNNFQNFPVLTTATQGVGGTLITGTLKAAPNTTYRIEFFANNRDPIGAIVEGQLFFGFLNVTTDANGNATFSANLGVSVAVGSNVTATATDPIGNTSEFSAPVSVAGIFAVGAGAGGGPEVKVYDAATGALKLDFFAFAANFTGGVTVATGDLNGGGGIPDIIVGAGPGGSPEVRVFSGVDGHLMLHFFAYDPAFTGGVFVAAADVNGDGYADIITGAGAGGGPHVKVFDGKRLALLASFFAYAPNFAGGVRVAGADVNGDGKADIITGPGAGGGPEVRVFSGATQGLLFDYLAFGASYTGGISVAGGDVDGDGKAEMIVGQSQSAGAAVRTFSGVDSHMLLQITPFATGSGGIRVDGVDRDSDGLADVLVGTGSGIASDVRTFKGTTLAQIGGDILPFDPGFLGGIFV